MIQQTEPVTRSLETKSGTLFYELVRTNRRRSIEISVREDFRVRVKAPRATLLRDITAFLQEKNDWIANQMQQVSRRREIVAARQYRDGSSFLFLGEECPLQVSEQAGGREGIDFDGSAWRIRLRAGYEQKENEGRIKEMLVRWYRRQAEEVLGTRLFFYGRQLGAQLEKVAVRTQKRIWGNCDHRRKVIHLNWQLVLAPLPVIDYVLVHELCHLEVPNHSPRFWQRVAHAMPEYAQHRAWLRAHAARLVLP